MQEMRETWLDPWVRKVPWRRKWQPAPEFLPGKLHGQRSLAGYSPWGHKESLRTDRASMCARAQHTKVPRPPTSDFYLLLSLKYQLQLLPAFPFLHPTPTAFIESVLPLVPPPSPHQLLPFFMVC